MLAGLGGTERSIVADAQSLESEGQDPAFREIASGIHEDREEADARLERFVAEEVLPQGWWA